MLLLLRGRLGYFCTRKEEASAIGQPASAVTHFVRRSREEIRSQTTCRRKVRALRGTLTYWALGNASNTTRVLGVSLHVALGNNIYRGA